MLRAWVIGGRRGIGKEITLELEHRDVFVMPTDETTVDVTSMFQLTKAFDDFKPNWIVYCAGVNKLMPAADFDEFEALNILDINALGFMRVIHLVAEARPHLQPRSVVAITSDAATRPMRNSMAYCASKAALTMAVRCAARELAPGVQVNAIAPGIIADTPMTEYTDQAVEAIRHWTPEQAMQYEAAGIPMGRRGTKEEIAHMTYRILDSVQYLTGAIIEINGGR
jgi:NAD(P)-dependent dehydrogenase (short-subunit alcohol dehydrogenase family)